MAIAKAIPEWWMPAAWPVFWRRAFLITLPVSGLLWLAAVVVCGVGAMLIAMCALPIIWIVELKDRLWDAQPGERS